LLNCSSNRRKRFRSFISRHSLYIGNRFGFLAFTLSNSLLPRLRKLVDFQAVEEKVSKVQLLRSNGIQSGTLQVLWIQSLRPWAADSPYLHVSNPNLFRTLVSLKVMVNLDHQDWRNILVHCCWSLKHLYIYFNKKPAGQVIMPLEFPALEVLEFLQEGVKPIQRFPAWIKVPSTLKVFSDRIHRFFPPIEELWISSMEEWPRNST